MKVEIVNAGIGGHKAPDMAARLQKDVIDKKPTIVTVSCGVNDVWHGFYNPPRGVDLETYRRLMTQIVQQLKINTSAAIADSDDHSRKLAGTREPQAGSLLPGCP
ncbi:MAG TPA: GDSL-type esterase/lipase family protein [Terriglobia bacterium]|nr:GDSL-type esterase/lipase family protein [Terriglobia bacterium]